MVDQPELPDSIPWPDATVTWWQSIAAAPEAKRWTATQWQYLLDTALVHADLWGGNIDRAAELRARLLEFGFTPLSASRLGSDASPGAGKDATPLDQLAARRAARGPNPPTVGKATP